MVVDEKGLRTPEKGGDVLWVESGRRWEKEEMGGGRVLEISRLEMVTFWPGTCNFWTLGFGQNQNQYQNQNQTGKSKTGDMDLTTIRKEREDTDTSADHGADQLGVDGWTGMGKGKCHPATVQDVKPPRPEQPRLVGTDTNGGECET